MDYINLLLQVPMAGVIVFVVIKFLEHINLSNDKWLGILDEQREANKSLFETLAEKIEKIAIGIGDTNCKVDKLEDKVSNIEILISSKKEDK